MDEGIIKRLRRMAMRTTDGDDRHTLADAASQIERLRAAGDALAAVVRDLGPGGGWDAAVTNWQEARRGPECVAIRAAHDAWQKARRG